MKLLELIQRDIDEIAEWGYCNFAETFKTLLLAKEEIVKLRNQSNNVIANDVTNLNNYKTLEKIDNKLDDLKKVHGDIIKVYDVHPATSGVKFKDGKTYRINLSRNSGVATAD